MHRPTALAFALAFVVALATGCPPQPPPAPPSLPASTGPAPVALQGTPLDARELPVRCGCELPDVGRCSEWADLDGRMVQLDGHGLGSMPFCRKPGTRARITGLLEGELIHVSKIEVLPAPPR